MKCECFVLVLFDRITLIYLSSFWPRSQWEGRKKDVVQSSYCKHAQLPWDTCLMFDICLDDPFFFVCLAPCQNLLRSHPSNAQPSISLAYSVSILLVTSSFTFVFYFCCFTTTTIVTTITPILLLLLILCCKQVLSGAVELTTQLSKLVRILWLPLCRIYKLGYSYPRRLSRSPTLVGHHALVKRTHPLIISISQSNQENSKNQVS